MNICINEATKTTTTYTFEYKDNKLHFYFNDFEKMSIELQK